MTLKRVLIISYYWPPAGGGGVQRWLHFAKQLKAANIEPIVLTVNESNASYPLLDESLCEQVKHIDTIRTKSFEVLSLYSFLKSGKKGNIPYGGLPKPTSFFAKISAWIRGNVFLPDARVGWNLYATKAAKIRLREGDVSHFITTGPPHSSHLMGLALKKEFPQLHWIADFRDPWTELYINETLPQSKMAKKYNESLEKNVLNSADTVITIGNELAKLLSAKTETKRDIEVIYNGFDENLFANKQPKQTATFIILHLGLLGDKQDVSPLAIALKKIAEKNSNTAIEFRVVGKIADIQSKRLAEICPTVRLTILGYLPQQKAIEEMYSANLLLNITPVTENEKIMVSTKTMEYLRTSMPVLVISDEGVEFDFLFQHQEYLKTFKRNDEDSIATFIEKLYSKWQQKENCFSEIDVSMYSRQSSAKKLVEILRK